MSDSSSDDDMPLLQRPAASKVVTAPLLEPKDPVPKLLGADDSDSEDDVPLAAKKPASVKKEAPVKVKKEAPAAVKKEAKVPVLKPKPQPKVKREVLSDSDSEDDIPLAAKKATPVAKKKPAAAAKKTVAVKKLPSSATKAKKEKTDKPVKKFEMPGQTRETPPENDPLRVFYSSLYEQTKGRSDMAAKWMLMNGLFKREVAEATVERFKQLKAKTGASPAKPGSAIKASPYRPGSAVKSSPSPALKRKNSAGGSEKKKVVKVKAEK